VQPFGDKEDAESSLRGLLGREGSFQNDISSPDKRGLLDQLYSAEVVSEGEVAAWRNRLTACASGGEPSWDVRDRRFVEHLRTLKPEALDRLAFWSPEDSLEVTYSRRADGTDFEPISRGSPGEKTAAILAFLLSYGDEPIVLDQPEDDLDSRLIYDLIVAQLKENKKRRQIVVVTHNANIVVNGDSEFIASLDFKTGHTVISESGGLQEDALREEICAVMEGGRAAFEQRYQRIGRPSSV
jgi:ATPase subunit of ABC transporter with duplicated ATPase domains